jgi:hypothetical protein
MKKIIVCIIVSLVLCFLCRSDAANVAISGLGAHSGRPATGDLVEIVDVSDTAMSANGTNKKVTVGDLTKLTIYIVLASPMRCDETGALVQTTAATDYRGQCKFSNSVDVAGNYALYWLVVPEDLDTATDLKVARWKFRLGGADTGKHRYIISMSSTADSATYAGSFSNAINLDFTGDASGADGDVETVSNITLTSWRSSLTAGQLWVIKVGRDGDDGTNDTSTVDSYSGPLVISYQATQ